MKKHEEMIRDVHRRIDEYESENKVKRAKITKIAVSVTPVCAAAVIGVVLWKGGVLTPSHDQLISNTIDSANNADESANTVESTSTAKVTDSAQQKAEGISSNNDSIQTTESSAEETAFDDVTNPPMNNNMDAVNETSIINNDTSQSVTENTHSEAQTGSSVQQNEDFCDRLGDATIDGVYYIQFFDDTVYTPENYLGNGGNFKGFYEGDINTEFYTAKERSDIIIVMLKNGGQVYLIETDISPEGE